MIAGLVDTEHLIIAILVLLVALLVVASGQGLGGVVMASFKKLFGKGDVNINLGREMAKLPKECENCGLVVDPSKCVMHSSEHERSLRNESSIKELWKNYGEMRKEMSQGFEKVQTSINTGQLNIISTQVKILAALGKRPEDWKDGGGGGFE